MCVFSNNIITIALDKSNIKSSIEEKILLSEESSHYKTNSLYMINNMYNTNLYRSNRSKYETQAKRNSVKKLLPLRCIKECIKKGILILSEMAEELEVTQEFLEYAINMYILKNELDINNLMLRNEGIFNAFRN